MNKRLVKELFIILLLLIVVVFTIGILFYDNISTDVEKIDSTEYVSDASVRKFLNEVDSESEKDGTSDSTVFSGSVSEKDIDEYISENSFETGKKNPFSESSDIQNNDAEDNSKQKIVENTAVNTRDKEVETAAQNTVVRNNEEVPTNTAVKTNENTAANTPVNTAPKTNNTASTNTTAKTNENTATNKTDTSSSSTGRFFENKTSK